MIVLYDLTFQFHWRNGIGLTELSKVWAFGGSRQLRGGGFPELCRRPMLLHIADLVVGSKTAASGFALGGPEPQPLQLDVF